MDFSLGLVVAVVVRCLRAVGDGVDVPSVDFSLGLVVVRCLRTVGDGVQGRRKERGNVEIKGKEEREKSGKEKDKLEVKVRDNAEVKERGNVEVKGKEEAADSGRR